MIHPGVKAKITCVDLRENAEFHTFVYDAPVFAAPIQVQMGSATGSFLPTGSLPFELCRRQPYEIIRLDKRDTLPPMLRRSPSESSQKLSIIFMAPGIVRLNRG